MTRRIALFGDTFGVPLTLKAVPADLIAACVAAGIRPQQHAELRRLCEAHHIPFLIQPLASAKSYPEFVQCVRDLRPDVILSNSYSMLIRPDILLIPRLGAVNIHGALLPQYRGCNPIQWALLNNEIETGPTMHYMAAEFDAGDIIAQRQVPIYIQDTWLDVLARIGGATEEMLREEMPKLLAQTNDRKPQDESRAHYYKRRHPEDGIIDWKQHNVLHVYNLVRALVKPHPGAFYYCGDEKVVLDEYLTFSQVTALKYGDAGRQTLADESIYLAPLSHIDQSIDLRLIKNHYEKSFSTISRDSASAADDGGWCEPIPQRNDGVTFSIHLRKTDQMIGLGAFRLIDFSSHASELQLWLGDASAEDYLGAQAMRLLLHFAFDELNLHRVYLTIASTDKAAVRTCENVGFIREELLRDAAYYGGGYADLVVMAILREKFCA